MPTIEDLKRALLTSGGTWTHGTAATAPVAGTTLVTVTAAAATRVVYGMIISAEEDNSFLVSWRESGVTKTYRIVTPSAGTFIFRDNASFANADIGSPVTITNVLAGGAGAVYQASLFLGAP